MSFDMVKFSLLSLFLGMSVLLGCGEIKGQNPEIYPLWPMGTKEENGLAGKERKDDNGRVTNCCVAEMYVYYPGQKVNTNKVIVICPGGGYTHLAMNHEGHLFARWLNERGITAVILKYRMPNGHERIPLADAQQAIRWVRMQAKEWGIYPVKVGIAGFSAGGHLASTLMTHYEQGNENASEPIKRFNSRPDFALLFYPVISMQAGLTHAGSRHALLGEEPGMDKVNEYSGELHVTAQTPPAFIVHSDDDKAVSVMNSVSFYQALKKHDVPAVLYIFPKGGHGWGLRDSYEYYPEWTTLLEKWLETL